MMLLQHHRNAQMHDTINTLQRSGQAQNRGCLQQAMNFRWEMACACSDNRGSRTLADVHYGLDRYT